YFAGLIDGEGYIGLHKKDKSRIRPMISVDMTCQTTIDAIHCYFRVGTVRPKKIRKPHHKPMFRWCAIYNDARMVISRILPFMITKRKDAELVLAHKPKPKGRPKLDG